MFNHLIRNFKPTNYIKKHFFSNQCELTVMSKYDLKSISFWTTVNCVTNILILIFK